MTTLHIEDGRTTFKTFTAIIGLAARRTLGFITHPGTIIVVSLILLILAGVLSYLINGYAAVEYTSVSSWSRASIFVLMCTCGLAGTLLTKLIEIPVRCLRHPWEADNAYTYQMYCTRALTVFGSAFSLLLFCHFGLFTCNRSWLKAEGAALIIDGKPITGTEVVHMNPFVQDISILPLDFSIKDLLCTGTTKDGVQICSNVTVTLRRGEDPNHWTDQKRITPSLERVISQRFKAACSEMTASEIAVSGLSLEFQTAKDDKLAAILPPAVQLNGLVKVDDIHVFIRK